VKEAAARPLQDGQIELAINSRPGRTQDQLHIHVDCLHQTYADEVRAHDCEIREKNWTRLRFPLRSRYYWAIRLGSRLKDVNVFALAATLLRLSPGRMEDMTWSQFRDLLRARARTSPFWLASTLRRVQAAGTVNFCWIIHVRRAEFPERHCLAVGNVYRFASNPSTAGMIRKW
jgi:CDP-diacylglycerol pyrophosphatase